MLQLSADVHLIFEIMLRMQFSPNEWRILERSVLVLWHPLMSPLGLIDQSCTGLNLCTDPKGQDK